ncbi:hypothetical protein FRAHR75_400028 [Frankia sp. Hr75.2]|nr:hypothetical protein FRAHR75_400028 [Frankia sp. Hr75.2]
MRHVCDGDIPPAIAVDTRQVGVLDTDRLALIFSSRIRVLLIRAVVYGRNVIRRQARNVSVRWRFESLSISRSGRRDTRPHDA